MSHHTSTRRSVLSKLGSAVIMGSGVAVGSANTTAAEAVELRVKGSQSGINYRVEYDTGPVETTSNSSDEDAGSSYADGNVDDPSDKDVFSVPADASANRFYVENTNDSSVTCEFEHGNVDLLSSRVDGDVEITSPNNTKTQYELHTPLGSSVRVYSNYTEIFQDEKKQSSRYKCGEMADGAVNNNKDLWDVGGQFRFVVLELGSNAEFELTRDLL